MRTTKRTKVFLKIKKVYLPKDYISICYTVTKYKYIDFNAFQGTLDSVVRKRIKSITRGNNLFIIPSL